MRFTRLGLIFLASSLCAEETSSMDAHVDFSFPQTSSLFFTSQNNLKGERLFWKGNSSALSKALIRTDKNSVLHGHVQDSKHSWEWGFRSGVKYDDFQEDWNVAGTYTHFHSKSFASMQRDGFLLPVWQEAGSFNEEESTSWRLDLEIADLEMGKTFFLKKQVSLRPHLGVRGTWMYQKFEMDSRNAFSEGFFKDPALWNNCLGVGTRTGLDTLWSLGKGVRIFGDGALSWLTGYHNIHQRQSLVQLGPAQGKVHPNIGIAIAEVSLGLQYDRSSFNMRLGYELSYFFNKNRFADWFSPYSQNERRISLQGFSFGVGFVF